jgi:hypothetical protein
LEIIGIILLHFVIYAFPVVLGAVFSKEVQIYLHYTLVGAIFTLTQLFDTLYSLELRGDFYLNGGDIAYSALLFSSVFLIISQPEPRVVRNLIYFVFILNLFLSFIFLLVMEVFNSEWGVGSAEISILLLQFSMKSLFYSFFLFTSEILLQLFIFRKLLPHFHHQVTNSLIIALIYAFVLILDGIFYPLGINVIIPGSNYNIVHGIMSKVIFGAGFGIILFIYLNFFPSKISAWITDQKSFLLYILPPKRRNLIEKLKEAQTEINHLREILPICVKCKKIRNDQGYWTEVEQYFKEHSDIDFTHGLCEECIKELYPDIADEIIDTPKKQENRKRNQNLKKN